MRLRAISSVTVMVLALLLAAMPVSAAGPFAPATGHWASAGGSVNPAFAFGSGGGVVDTRIGPDGKLYAFGNFANASGHATADNLAVFDTATHTWKGLGSNGAGDGALNNTVYAVAWVGSTLYAAGRFVSAGGVVGADAIASWNGSAWSTVGGASAIGGAISTMIVWNGLVYVGGSFSNAGGDATADNVAVWNGASWSGLASSGDLDGAITGDVWSLQVLSDGRVYVGGSFSNDGPSGLCDAVCWWDPASENWNPVGGSAAPDNVFGNTVYAVLVSGARVYVGGMFTNPMGKPKASFVAVWTGSTWTNLGSNGASGPLNGPVYGLRAYGSNIFATGAFTNAGGVAAADGIAAWNGAKWLALGSPKPTPTVVFRAMVTGRTLYMSGSFSKVAGLANTKGLAAYGLPATPSAPRSLAGLAGHHRVTLTWLAPSKSNGSSVVDYVVQYRKYGTTTRKTFADGVHTTHSAAVTGLASHARYQFRVAAKNSWGIGPWSAVISRYAG